MRGVAPPVSHLSTPPAGKLRFAPPTEPDMYYQVGCGNSETVPVSLHGVNNRQTIMPGTEEDYFELRYVCILAFVYFCDH